MPTNSPKLIGGVAILLLIATALMSTFYKVETGSQGVVLRFGKFVKLAPPGLHTKLPFGIDTVSTVPVLRQLKQEFGFGTAGATNDSQVDDRRQWEDAKSMVTGDLNAALVEWVIQYRVDDPERFLFNVRNAEDTLRDASESVMRTVIGDRTVDEVITIGRQEIETQALVQLQELARSYAMGLKIDQVQLKNVNPPLPVQASFNEVNQAQQEKERAINVARGEFNKVIPRASGEKDQQIKGAQGYALKRVNEAEGDASAFNALLEEYVKAPEVTRRRIYLETLGEILPKVGKKIVLDGDSTSAPLPFLDLNGPGSTQNPIRRATN
jgi:membrane protease subunit HflK